MPVKEKEKKLQDISNTPSKRVKGKDRAIDNRKLKQKPSCGPSRTVLTSQAPKIRRSLSESAKSRSKARSALKR